MIDEVVGDAPATVDITKRQAPGTTRASIIEAVLNPPDAGSVSVTATAYAGPVSLSTDGTVNAYVGGVLGVSVDATYVAPGSNRDALAIGTVAGGGLIGGLSVGARSNGLPNSASVSVGVGVAAALPRVPAVFKVGSGRFNLFGGK